MLYEDFQTTVDRPRPSQAKGHHDELAHTADRKRGITSFLEDLNFADDSVLPSSCFCDIEEKIDQVTSFASQIGLKVAR